MAKALPPLSAEDLWRLPRVGAPRPSPDGRQVLVTVTDYDLDANRGRSRLWLLPADARGAGAGGRADSARPLTAPEHSCRQPAWAPDGRSIVYLREPGEGDGAFGDRPQLYLLRLDGGEARRLTDLPFGVADPTWMPGGRGLVIVSEMAADAPGPEGAAALRAARAADKVGARVSEDRVYRYWDHWLETDRHHHLLWLDPDGGAPVDLTPGSQRWFEPMDPSGQYDLAPDGDELAFSACASRPPHDPWRWGVFTVALRWGADGRPRPGRPRALGGRWKGGARRPRYSPDGRSLVYGMRREHDFYADRTRLVLRDRASGDEQVLTEDWDASAQDWTFADRGRQLLLLAETGARVGVYGFPLAAARRSGVATPRLLRRGGTYSGLAAAGERLLVNHSSLREAPELLSMGLDGASPRQLTAFTRPLLAARRLGEVEERRFRGAGGRQVQMFLIHPPGPRRRRRPLLQLVHGGPHGVFGDQWHWRWNAQLFASTGCLCACVNFHGSTGWGQDFAASILGRWGDQPYDDVMAATDALVAEGLADPQRLAAAGGSYGGYLIAWLAAKTRRFKCLVNHAGVSDLQSQYASDVTQGRRRAMGGEPWADLEGLDRYNPMRHAAGFATPMLVLHGERDYRVPYQQGLEIYNVYRAMGLPARLVVYPDENHWILKPQSSVHWYGEVFAWLERWLSPPAARRKRR